MEHLIEPSLVIVGLGNPGRKYAYTRHNMGYMVLQTFAQQLEWSFKEEKEVFASVAKGKIYQGMLHLLLPETYMNESGKAVKRYLDLFHLKHQDLIVVCDDVWLDFGRLRVRPSGSSGGHNGLKSIQQYCQTQDFIRLRMGVGRPPESEELTSHVLGEFSLEEKESLASFLMQGVEELRRLIYERSY
jgi:PTH1 family peptidyl-tRNA hydrolase